MTRFEFLFVIFFLEKVVIFPAAFGSWVNQIPCENVCGGLDTKIRRCQGDRVDCVGEALHREICWDDDCCGKFVSEIFSKSLLVVHN